MKGKFKNYFSRFVKGIGKKTFKCVFTNTYECKALMHEETIKIDGEDYCIANCLIYDADSFCDKCPKRKEIKEFINSEEGKKEVEILRKYLYSVAIYQL